MLRLHFTEQQWHHFKNMGEVVTFMMIVTPFCSSEIKKKMKKCHNDVTLVFSLNWD